MLSLRHATEVTDLKSVTELATTEDDDTSHHVARYISEQGRVIAWRTRAGDHVVRAEEIKVDDDHDWAPIGTPRIFRFDTNDEGRIRDDARRLFLSQSLSNGGARMSTGWRGRVVALVPEEVGAKESNIIRTLADGGIECTHTYNVLDAYAKYSEWVNALSSEFGSSDEKLEAGIGTPDTTPFGFPMANIVQSWLMREAAEAALHQARHSLKFGLAAFSRLPSYGIAPGGSVSELARSLHTDRPNLARAIKSAEADPEMTELFAKINRGGR